MTLVHAMLSFAVPETGRRASCPTSGSPVWPPLLCFPRGRPAVQAEIASTPVYRPQDPRVAARCWAARAPPPLRLLLLPPCDRPPPLEISRASRRSGRCEGSGRPALPWTLRDWAADAVRRAGARWRCSRACTARSRRRLALPTRTAGRCRPSRRPPAIRRGLAPCLLCGVMCVLAMNTSGDEHAYGQ